MSGAITTAAQSGDTRAVLVATRDRIARALDDDNCPKRDLASLSKRLVDITTEIEAIDARAQEEGGGAAQTPDEDWSPG